MMKDVLWIVIAIAFSIGLHTAARANGSHLSVLGRRLLNAFTAIGALGGLMLIAICVIGHFRTDFFYRGDSIETYQIQNNIIFSIAALSIVADSIALYIFCDPKKAGSL